MYAVDGEDGMSICNLETVDVYSVDRHGEHCVNLKPQRNSIQILDAVL